MGVFLLPRASKALSHWPGAVELDSEILLLIIIIYSTPSERLRSAAGMFHQRTGQTSVLRTVICALLRCSHHMLLYRLKARHLFTSTLQHPDTHMHLNTQQHTSPRNATQNSSNVRKPSKKSKGCFITCCSSGCVPYCIWQCFAFDNLFNFNLACRYNERLLFFIADVCSY